MNGQSKLRFVNIYIWDVPWFIELDEKQKLAYFYMHSKCSDIGIYLHSEKAMQNHIGFSYNLDEILAWLNQKRDIVIKVNDETLLLHWLIRESSKRGSKIKPNSNPELGKIREAIDSKLLDKLIVNGTFHPECKYFEFGLSESLIENKPYSTKLKKGKKQSDYDEMLERVKACINHSEGYSKAFERFIEGLPEPFQSVLNQNPYKSETANKPPFPSPTQSIYTEIADGFKFDCPDFLIEEEVEKELKTISSVIPGAEELIISYKEEYIREYGRGQSWDSFIKYLSEKL